MGNPKKLSRGFDDAWRNKMLQFQTPIFSPMTRGEWVLRFDDILADAKEQGRLRDRDILLFAETPERRSYGGGEMIIRKNNHYE